MIEQYKIFDEFAFYICNDGFHVIRDVNDLKKVNFSESLAYAHCQIQPYAKACGELYDLTAKTYGTMKLLLTNIYNFFINSNLTRICTDIPCNKFNFFESLNWKLGWQYNSTNECWVYIDIIENYE